MDSTEPRQNPDETLTFVIKRSTRSRVLAKLILLVGLTAFGSYWVIQNSAQKYEKGRRLTKEEYEAGFDRYKRSLLSAEQLSDKPLTSFVMLMTVSFFFGSYELVALLLGLMIGKLSR
jgi:hypothetical protein